jgi:hypothetical protein
MFQAIHTLTTTAYISQLMARGRGEGRLVDRITRATLFNGGHAQYGFQQTMK